MHRSLNRTEKLGIFGHGYTYSAHPVCAAVALRTQKLMQERDVIGHVRSIMPTFAGHVASMNKYDFIGNVRSIGLIGAMEFAACENNHKKFDKSHKIAAQAVAIIQKHGVTPTCLARRYNWVLPAINHIQSGAG